MAITIAIPISLKLFLYYINQGSTSTLPAFYPHFSYSQVKLQIRVLEVSKIKYFCESAVNQKNVLSHLKFQNLLEQPNNIVVNVLHLERQYLTLTLNEVVDHFANLRIFSVYLLLYMISDIQLQ